MLIKLIFISFIMFFYLFLIYLLIYKCNTYGNIHYNIDKYLIIQENRNDNKKIFHKVPDYYFTNINPYLLNEQVYKIMSPIKKIKCYDEKLNIEEEVHNDEEKIISHMQSGIFNVYDYMVTPDIIISTYI